MNLYKQESDLLKQQPINLHSFIDSRWRGGRERKIQIVRERERKNERERQKDRVRERKKERKKHRERKRGKDKMTE